MNAAAAGKRALRRVMDDLTINGYTLIESHISRGPADLIAGKPGQRLAVQVKRGGGKHPLDVLRPADWNALLDHAAGFDALPVLAVAPPRKPVAYWLLTGRKDGSRRRQPMVPLVLDEICGAA